MVINNKESEKKVKRIFFIVCLLLALVAAAFILVEKYMVAIICGCAFAVWYLIFRAIDFQYIEFSNEEAKFVVRFYPIVKFGSKEYNSIEFPNQSLHDVKLKTALFGLIIDLTLAVKTKRGIAEYPSVNIAAVPKKDRKLIIDSLHVIMGK